MSHGNPITNNTGDMSMECSSETEAILWIVTGVLFLIILIIGPGNN